MITKGVQAGLLLAMLLGLPALGLFISGQDVASVLQFPSQTKWVNPPGFSWWIFAFFLIAECACILPLLAWCLFRVQPQLFFARRHRRLPWYGWVGLVLTATAWVLAWTRLPCFAWGQLYTFPFLWIGYILVVNALTYRRSGRCMLQDRPQKLLILFPLSSIFWWFFEYLNRFVHNWHYLAVEGMSSSEYVLHASICFATVLPAVLSTRDLLSTFPVFDQCYARIMPLRPSHPRGLALTVCALAGAGLVGIGIWPNQLFPLLWVSPLLILVSVQALFAQDQVFSPLAEGNWTPVVTAALAALICGFFWEMWNVNSMAKWVYSIPYVQRFQIFEMPILGYAGYLPFGLQCAAVETWILRSWQ